MENFSLLDIRALERNARNKLLEQFYNQFLVRYFGINPDQLEPLDKLMNALEPEHEAFYRTVMHVLVAFNEKKEMIGGSLFELFPKSQIGLVSYFCVDPPYRRYGIGKILLDEASKIMDKDCMHFFGNTCYAVLLETNSPLKMKKDTFDPRKRLQVLRNLGCQLISFEYVQPPLSPTLDVDTNLVLLSLEIKEGARNHLEGNAILSFLEEYWINCKADLKHPLFRKSVRALRNKKVSLRTLNMENIRKIEYNVTGKHPVSITTLPLSADDHAGASSLPSQILLDQESIILQQVQSEKIKFSSKL